MSPSVEIHGYVTCPFAWRVRLAAAEKGVAADWIPCDVDDPDPRAREHNPDEHSPLLYQDGFHLVESEIMMQYVDEAFEGRPLMPADARARAQLRLVATRLRGLDVHTEPAKPEARRRSEPALRTLEVLLEGGRQYLHGAEPGHVDCLIWPFLANVKVRGLVREHALPNVAGYLQRVTARASFRTTLPPWAEPLA